MTYSTSFDGTIVGRLYVPLLVEQECFVVQIWSCFGVKEPFFSSMKNFLRIGSIPAVVFAKCWRVEPVSATAHQIVTIADTVFSNVCAANCFPLTIGCSHDV